MAILNLNLASPRHILASLSRLKPDYNLRNSWVPNSNIYVIDTLEKLKTGFAAGGTINTLDIIDYISSSISIHCYNSWSYLSASINSYLEGDFANAIHNAYYSELRAIMSFLASRGIGVFNTHNVIVDDNGNVHKADCPWHESRTHSFAKTAFDQWLSTPNRTETLLELIPIEGNSLKNWFDATSFPPASNLPGIVASNWLKEWSLDMSIISNDQDFRNFVSYRPQNFNFNFSRLSDNIKFRLNFVIELWQLCSPKNFFNFSILRNSFEILYKLLFEYNNLSELDIEKDIKPILTELGMDPDNITNEYIIKFLRREVEPDTNKLFEYAKLQFSSPILETDTEPIGIISRACLLTLITTRILETILKQTVTSKADLKSWYNHIGIKLGYWTEASEPYLYSDLWNDIEIEIDEIKNWMNRAVVDHSCFTYKTDLKEYSSNIRHLNKTYLWSTAV